MKAFYDKLPVYYCADCKSLYILRSAIGRSSISYCGKCGNTAVVKTDIHKYLKMLENAGKGIKCSE